MRLRRRKDSTPAASLASSSRVCCAGAGVGSEAERAERKRERAQRKRRRVREATAVSDLHRIAPNPRIRRANEPTRTTTSSPVAG